MLGRRCLSVCLSTCISCFPHFSVLSVCTSGSYRYCIFQFFIEIFFFFFGGGEGYFILPILMHMFLWVHFFADTFVSEQSSCAFLSEDVNTREDNVNQSSTVHMVVVFEHSFGHESVRKAE